MLEDYSDTDKRLEGGITIGRIAYIVISLLLCIPLLFLINTPIKNIDYIGFALFGLLIVFGSIPLTIIGCFSIVRAVRAGHTKLFWVTATVIAALPLYWFTGAIVYAAFH
jgi:hypothetical protein